MGEHGVLLTVLDQHYQKAATKENLEAAIVVTRQHIDAAIVTQNAHLDTKMGAVKGDIKLLADQLAPIAKGVYAVIWLVIAAVLVAMMALVIRGGPPQ